VLNTPLPIEAMRSAWHSPCVAIRVAADGGANRLAAAAPELLPDVVVGDFGPSWA
jgi:thiamine pyrophosphokinase